MGGREIIKKQKKEGVEKKVKKAKVPLAS